MPIRFRCVYCDQLLGIAHRKAGTVVKCPNCAGQLMVPSPDASNDSSDPDAPTAAAEEFAAAPERTATATAPSSAAADGGMLFERNDFDELLKPALEKKSSALAVRPARASRAAAQGAPSRPAPNSFDFAPAAEPVDQPRPVVATSQMEPRRTGILLTPLKLVLLTLVVMCGMGCAFAGGFLLSWYLK